MRLINVGWWESLAHALFGVTGPNPIPDLADHLQAVSDLSRMRPEWMYAAGWIPFQSVKQTQAAVAGQFQSIILHNPPDSGVLAVVDGVQQDSGLEENLGTLRDEGLTGVTATTTLFFARDARYIALGDTGIRTGLQLQTRSAAGSLLGTGAWTIGAQNTALIHAKLWHWYVLHPGSLLILESELTNQGAGPAAFLGYVLPLHKGKRL